MNRLKFMRIRKGLTMRQLGIDSKVSASDICKAEKHGLRLYQAQAQRVAIALGWQGDPMDLFKEVSDDGNTAA